MSVYKNNQTFSASTQQIHCGSQQTKEARTCSVDSVKIWRLVIRNKFALKQCKRFLSHLKSVSTFRRETRSSLLSVYKCDE